MVNNFCEKHFKTILCLLTVLCTVLCVVLCQGELVWADEAYSLGMIRNSYADMCKTTALDVHPPLYYILLKAFATPFSNKILAGKIFSLIPFVITCAFGGVQIKKLFNAKAGLIFSFLFISSPFLQQYTVEIRMYSLSALFVFCNAVFAYKAYVFNGKKDWVLYTFFGLASAYTHYFALVSVGIIYGMLFFAILIKKRELIKPWVITAIMTVILYIPWLRLFIIQLKYKMDNEYWIEPITLKTIKSYFIEMFGVRKNLWTAVTALICYVMMLAGLYKKEKNQYIPAMLSASVPALTLATGLLASFAVRPVFVVRYLAPSVPLLFAAAAIGLSFIKKWQISALIFVILSSISVWNYTYVYDDKNTHFENRMDEAFHERNIDCDAYIIDIDRDDITPGQTEMVFGYYETEKEIYQVIEDYKYYPFKNFRYIGDFDHTQYDELIMLVAQGKGVPDSLQKIYDCEYRETTTSLWIMADVYKLTKK